MNTYTGGTNVSGYLQIDSVAGLGSGPLTINLDGSLGVIGNGGAFTGYVNNAGEFSVCAPNGASVTLRGGMGGNGMMFVGLTNGGWGPNGTGTVMQDMGTVSVSLLWVGASDGSGSATYTLSGSGALSSQLRLSVGCYGGGTFNQTGGTNSIVDNNGALLAVGISGSGTYVLSAGELSAPQECIGTDDGFGPNFCGRGTFTQSGGTNSTDMLTLATAAGAVGTYTITGGTLDVRNGSIRSGTGGTGQFNLNGGLVIANQINIIPGTIVFSSNGLGILRVNSAIALPNNLALYNLEIGHSGGSKSGAYTVSNGQNLSVLNQLTIGYDAPGQFNLNGGTAILGGITKGTGTATFNFGGGTLKAGKSFSSNLPMTLTGVGGDAKVDTDIYTVTLSGPLSGSGGLSKQGTGSLVLSSSNSYAGATTINGGTLEVAVLADGGSPSGIGQSSSDAGNLVLNGGRLVYTGTVFVHTDRLFTLGDMGGSLDVSGSGAVGFWAVGFWSGGSIGFPSGSTGARTLTLTGTNMGQLAPRIGDAAPGSATSVTKEGSGAWYLSARNTYTGPTTIKAGMLDIYADYNLGLAPASLVADQLRLMGGTLVWSSGDPDASSLAPTRGLDVITSSGIEVSNWTSLTLLGPLTSNAGVTLTKTGGGTLIISGTQNWGAGSILQIGSSGGGSPEYFRGSSANSVPEPATLVMLAVGGLCLLGYAWRRHAWPFL